MQKQKTTNQLKNWLLVKPIMFMLLTFAFIIGFSILASIIDSVFGLSDQASVITMVTIVAISFIYPAYRLIKKLPDNKMYRPDFIAITNGATMISVISSLVTLSIVGVYGGTLNRDAMFLYMLHPTIFTIIFVCLILFTLYLIGVAISGLYAKYKRCRQIGLDAWKIILSMPFAFLLLWTPGYLIKDRTQKTELEIKSNWYARFNQWVLSDFSNTLFIFLFLLFCKNIISGTPVLILSVLLLALYALWNAKHKSDFIKNINRGYALTAIGINIAIIIVSLFQHI